MYGKVARLLFNFCGTHCSLDLSKISGHLCFCTKRVEFLKLQCALVCSHSCYIKKCAFSLNVLTSMYPDKYPWKGQADINTQEAKFTNLNGVEDGFP